MRKKTRNLFADQPIIVSMAKLDSSGDTPSGVRARPDTYLTLSTQLLEPVPGDHHGLGNRVLSKVDHPETVFSLVLTGQSLGGTVADRFVSGESTAGRFFGNFLPKFALALGGSFILHESGHKYRKLNYFANRVPQDVEVFVLP